MVNKMRMEDVHEEDELLQSHSENLTNEDLQEIQIRSFYKKQLTTIQKKKCKKKYVSMEFLSSSITTITNTMDQFVDNLD